MARRVDASWWISWGNTHKQLYPKHFESYSNWQLHSTIDIHWPLSNSSTQANYTSLDNNHDNSASSVSHKETLQAVHAQTISLKKSKVKPLNPATIGCFLLTVFFILWLALPATIPHLNNERSLLYILISVWKRKSQIQLTCQHIDDMQLEIRFVGVLHVSCRTNHSPSQNQPTVTHTGVGETRWCTWRKGSAIGDLKDQ